jgi:hypothetical protein
VAQWALAARAHLSCLPIKGRGEEELAHVHRLHARHRRAESSLRAQMVKGQAKGHCRE